MGRYVKSGCLTFSVLLTTGMDLWYLIFSLNNTSGTSRISVLFMFTFSSCRFLYRTLQGTLFPTQLQLGRQLSKLPPEIRTQLLTKLNVKKESIHQTQPFANSFSPNFVTNASDCCKAYNQNAPLPTSPKDESLFQEHTKAEYTTGRIVAASPQGALQFSYSENKLPSETSSQDMSMGFHGTSEMDSLSMGATFPWSPAVDQTDFSLLKWITSTPLFSRFGTVLQVSSSSLQNETQDTMCVLGSSLHEDFKGLKEQSSNNFQDKMKGTPYDSCKSDNSETTFLWHGPQIYLYIFYLHTFIVRLLYLFPKMKQKIKGTEWLFKNV